MNTRRQWIQGAALAAAGAPMIVKASALGRGGTIAPSDRVTVANIGLGWMGFDGHVKDFLKVKGAQTVAVCDIDETHLADAKAFIDKAHGDQGCTTYHAFEEVVMRRDIDAVSIAVPDHWHALIAVQAARAKKDIYCEKPLAHTFHEGLMMVEESERQGRVWQTGSWQRSVSNFHQACELVRNGRIGRVKSIEVGLPSGFYALKDPERQLKVTDPPKTLFYDRWLGPAPDAPYCEARVHVNWRWNLDYGGGQLMDWIGHHVDIAHWGMGWDDNGPVEVEGVGEYPPHTDLFNAAKKYKVHCTYPDGTTMVIAGGYPEIRGGTKWIGEKGWIYVDRGKIDASQKSLLSDKIGENEIHLKNNGDAHGHYEEFIECVKSRGKTLTPARVALHSATPGWLGQIAMLTGRKIHWDPKKFEIAGDAEATKLLSRDMRAPYQL
jgi:predicted dehydrogenase